LVVVDITFLACSILAVVAILTVVAAITVVVVVGHGQKQKHFTAFVSCGSPSVVPTMAAILAGDQR
jgi:hypothetical protein